MKRVSEKVQKDPALLRMGQIEAEVQAHSSPVSFRGAQRKAEQSREDTTQSIMVPSPAYTLSLRCTGEPGDASFSP